MLQFNKRTSSDALELIIMLFCFIYHSTIDPEKIHSHLFS